MRCNVDFAGPIEATANIDSMKRTSLPLMFCSPHKSKRLKKEQSQQHRSQVYHLFKFNQPPINSDVNKNVNTDMNTNMFKV